MSSLSERLNTPLDTPTEETPWLQLENSNNNTSTPDKVPTVAELDAIYDTPSAETDMPSTQESVAELSQDTLITATSRVGRFLQRMSDRIENGADRADVASERYTDIKEKAKDKVRSFGHSALGRLKTAGLITVGLSIMGAEAAGRGAKKTAEATTAKVESARETVSDYHDARRQVAERKAEAAATAKYERHAAKIQKKNEKAQAKQERIDTRLEVARQRKEAALARKQARHDIWAQRREAVKQYGHDVKEGFVDAKDAAVSGAKFAGNTIKTNAEVAGALAAHMTREQKAKLGRLATKARAAGEGAVEGWKSV